MKLSEDIAAGDLNQRIALYTPVWNAAGDEITGYTQVAVGIAAAKRALKGREVYDAGRDTSEQWAVFTIRWRAGITSATRLTHAGVDYDIDGDPMDPTGTKRRLDITAKVVR